jgi:hypothetical protein
VMMRVTGSISTIASTVLSPWQPTDRVLRFIKRGWLCGCERVDGVAVAGRGNCEDLSSLLSRPTRGVFQCSYCRCPFSIQITTPVCDTKQIVLKWAYNTILVFDSYVI